MQILSTLRRFEAGAIDHALYTRTEAFAELYRRQWQRVYTFLRYRLRDATLAEDLTAEVFARAWASWTTRGQPPADEAAQAWLFITARNLAIDHLRRRPTGSLDGVPASLHPTCGSPEIGVLARDALNRIERCVADLGDREREVLGLRLAAGLRNGAIADIIKTSDGNVAKIIHRALRKVKRCMTEEGTSHD